MREAADCWGGGGGATESCFKKLERCGLETGAAGCWIGTDTWSNVIDPLLPASISHSNQRRRRRRELRCVKQIEKTEEKKKKNCVPAVEPQEGDRQNRNSVPLPPH
jgi:hypothetical protein